MTHQIDTSFRQRKQSFAAWRKKARRRRILAGAALLLAVSGGFGLYTLYNQWTYTDDLDEELQASDDMLDLPENAPVYVPAIVDLAGDPMWITLDRDPTATPKVKLVDRPEGLDATLPAKLEVLSDEMLSSSERFMTTIPSSQEDFAYFQAQRSGPVANAPTADDMDAVPDDAALDDTGPDLVPVDPDEETTPAPDSAPTNPEIADPEFAYDAEAGWGDIEAEDEAAPVSPAAPAPTFAKTAIEDTTTIGNVIPETDRFQTTEDTFVRIFGTRTLDSVVLDAGFSADDAKRASETLSSLFQKTGLEEGFVIAARGYRATRNATPSLVQLSVYTRTAYVGTLVRGDTGAFEAGVDPWVSNDLFNYSGLSDQGTSGRQYRLLDAIYSTAVRNNVPASVIGEAIVHLSRGNDLNLFAAQGDQLTLIYTQEPRGSGDPAGRVLYVAVHGTDRNLACYVFQQPDGTFSCTGEVQNQTVTVTAGMTSPVKGVLTSTFGPRKHPILKKVRLHKGVDWKAPVGTPIVAAFDGEITFQGNGGGYGNVVRMSHPGGRETRYAHMQRFAENSGAGKKVTAGTVIGYVGTTGLSTGPHLHFELYLNGTPIDPLGEVAVAMAAAPAPVAHAPVAPEPIPVPVVVASSSADEEAVEILTNRIIHVESGGKARAKNPLSSATGLGQFISKTWIRMMNTYRPDLARSMSTAELLELRFDPTISREMVKNLAREGEAYIKQRGHAITAGRLYLCHFLGMEGAHVVLSAPRSSQLIDVLGASVIKANPFLRGKDAGYVIEWAERKMRGKGAPPPSSSPSPGSTPAVAIEVRPVSPEFERYRVAIEEIRKAIAPAT